MWDYCLINRSFVCANSLHIVIDQTEFNIPQLLIKYLKRLESKDSFGFVSCECTWILIKTAECLVHPLARIDLGQTSHQASA